MTDSDKQALIDNICTVPTKMIINNGDGTTTTLTESDYVLNWEYEDFRFVPNEGFIGQFVERIVTGNLKNIDDSFSLTNKEFELQFGITTTDEEIIDTLDDFDNQSVNNKLINVNFKNYVVEELLPTATNGETFGAIGDEFLITFASGEIIQNVKIIPNYTTLYYPNGTVFDKNTNNNEFYVLLESYDLDKIYVLANINRLETYGEKLLETSSNLTLYNTILNFPTLVDSIQIITPGSEETHYYSLGHFIVSDPDDDNVKDKTEFKAIDYTKYFEKPFLPSLVYPTTLGCLAYACCKQCGVQLGDFTATQTVDVTIDNTKQYFTYDSTNEIYNYVSEPTVEDISSYYELSFGFSNSAFVIDSNPFTNNESCREVMKCVGKTAFSWVRIDWDDKCYIDYTKVTTVDSKNEIDNDHYYDLSSNGSTFGELNTIVVGMKDIDGENVTITDPNTVNPNTSELDVWDNPLTYTQEQREETIDAGQALFGLKYQDVELTTTGHPWLKGKEKIKIKDMENNYIYTYPFDRTISYNGHIKTKIKSTVISNINTQYTYENTIQNKLRNTQIMVDKANGQITSLVLETEQLSDTVTELGTRYTQNLDEFQYQISQLNNQVVENNENVQQQINDLENSVPTQLQNTLVTININGIQVSTNLSKVSTIVTNNTFAVQDSNGNYLTYIGYDEIEGRSKAEMDNLTVTNFFTAGLHRQQTFEPENEKRTGWFYIGG